MLTLTHRFEPGTVPSAFIERYRAADGPALKVALYLMLGNPADADVIACELQLAAPAVERSLEFWLRAGLLKESAETEKSDEPSVSAGTRKKASPTPAERRMPVTKIAESLRNPEIAALLQESQAYLGRTLSVSESERLLCIYEYDELPADVILTAVAYAKTRAKRNLIGYIERVTREWKEDGIDVLEKAEKHLALLALREERYERVSEVLGTDTSAFTYRNKRHIDAWFEDLGYNEVFVEEALERGGNNSPAYINKILCGWSAKGYASVKETRAEVSNTAAPVPRRRKKSEADSLFKMAFDETNVGTRQTAPRRSDV